MKKIMLVFGTRPDTVKMCPLVIEFKSRADVQTVVAVTGQHREMLQSQLDVFNVVPDYDLKIMQPGQTLFDVTERTMSGMRELLTREKPDVLLVHGDTSTAFASALAAYYLSDLGITVGHVEAGLRTYNIRSPYPEEFNRQAIDSMSEYLFAPTETSKANLLREGKDASRIYVTGNTEIDALKMTVRDGYTHPELDWVADGSRFVLMTAHRRENLGGTMRGMFHAIRNVVDEHPDVKLVYAVHLNPAVRDAAEVLANHPRVHLIEPPDVFDFHNLMARSHLVLTDSGGIQEAAPALGKPVIVLRDTTERPEGVEAGTLLVAGTSESSVYAEFTRLLTDRTLYDRMSRAVNPYGDGFASRRIADVVTGATG